MKDLSPSELKAILHSKRENIFYVEYGRALYLTESFSNKVQEHRYYDISIANTTVHNKASRTSNRVDDISGKCSPTEYVQAWIKFWFNDKKHLAVG